MPNPRKRVRHQAARKYAAKKCFFCPEKTYEALQCHRIIPGSEGGTYCQQNTLVVCSTCHSKITAGIIVVVARRYGTRGSYIHCFINDEEFFFFEGTFPGFVTSPSPGLLPALAG